MYHCAVCLIVAVDRRDPSVMDEVECHVKMMMALYQTGWMQGANSATKLRIAQVRTRCVSKLTL